MHQIRAILEHHFMHSMSNEKIAKNLNISKGSIFNTLKRFENANISRPLPIKIKDSELEEILFPVKELQKKR